MAEEAYRKFMARPGEHGYPGGESFADVHERSSRAIENLLEMRGEKLAEVRRKIEEEVRYANITIIEGHDASQYGIGIVAARIAEMIVTDERAVIPGRMVF